MDRQFDKMSTDELQASKTSLLSQRSELQSRLTAMLHEQARIDGDLSIVSLYLQKAKSA